MRPVARTLVLLAIVPGTVAALCIATPRPRLHYHAAALIRESSRACVLRLCVCRRSDSDQADKLECSDHRQDAATLFNNVRIPAALINTAALNGAFVMQPHVADPAPVVIVKRIYTLLAIASVSSELLAIVSSTAAINKLNELNTGPTASVIELLMSEPYEFSWISVNTQVDVHAVSTRIPSLSSGPT